MVYFVYCRMKLQVNNLEIFYQEFGKGERTIVLLHGWGQSHAFWKEFYTRMPGGYHVYILDLPGFGLSQEPSFVWSLEDYADFLKAFSTRLKINNPIIVGHSFGGRIASVYASKYPVKKLILYSNSGLPQMSLKTFVFKNIFNQIGKHFFPNQLYQLHTKLFKPKQYNNEIVLNRKRSRLILDMYTRPFPNLYKHFEKIKAPTLIITGSKDYLVSPKTGKRIHKLIKNSKLIGVKDASHFAHIEVPEVFYKEVTKFLSEK